VQSWYLTYLGRPAVDGEEQGWVKALLRGATEEQVLAGILGSAEFFNVAGNLGLPGTVDEQYIGALYSLLLNRTASSEEVSGWESVLPFAGRSRIAAAFLSSSEYRSDAVDSYYTGLLHRTTPPSPAEMYLWVHTPFDLLTIREGFETSPEFRQQGLG
jgi:hypothetical protein